MARIRERGIRAVPLRVSHAFHSAQMDPALAPFAEAFDGVRLHEPALDFVSDLTGELAGPEPATVDYWLRHARQAVRFADAGRALLADDMRIVVELGTGGLLPHIVSAAGSAVVTCLPSVASDGDSHRRLLESLARVWADGVPVDWARANGPRPARLPQLPTYPFQRQTYWEPSSPPVPGGTAAAPAAAPPRTTPQPTPAARPAPLAASSDSRDERVAALVAHLRRELAAVMELDDAGALDADTGLFDLGLTSTMVVELRVGIERALGRQIPTTAVFDHPTIRRLAAYLADLDVAAPAAPDRSAERAGGAGTTTEPIAIVGMGCRFPGGADDPDAFWRLLRDGVDAITRGARPTAGTSTPTTTPTPTRPARCTRAAAASSTDVDQFDAAVLRHLAARSASAWIRSSGCCSRWPGRRWRTPAAPPTRLAGTRDRRLRRHQHQRLRAAAVRRRHRRHRRVLRRPATPAASPPAGSRTCSACRARAWPSTPPARRRWSPSTWPARACAPASADLALAGGVNLMLAPEITVSLSQGAACWRRTAAARPSTPRPTATCAARAAASWCSSGCPTRSPTATASWR